MPNHKLAIPCPNNANGCKITFGAREIKDSAIQRHLKVCKFMRKVLAFQGEELELKPVRETKKGTRGKR